MIRFAEFESRGPALAAMTECRDGDFSFNSLQARSDLKQTFGDDRMVALQLISQVHGTKVITATEAPPGVAWLGEADALVTDHPGIALGIRVADCVPVFLYNPERHCAALIHAGREGTRLGISGMAVDVLSKEFGADPATTGALIGPSAGPCCYEVDLRTAKACEDSGLRVAGRMIDLWASNRDQLVRSGLRLGNVDMTQICTICSRTFHSYRRTGTRDRNLAVLML